MDKINLTRIRPERSEKRKMPSETLVKCSFRIPQADKNSLKAEAASLGLSENLYLNAIIKTRDPKKIKKILK